jgi:RNA polymerase-binding transcription factor DksA
MNRLASSPRQLVMKESALPPSRLVDENLAITAHLVRELGAVAQARVRLDAGKYGVCVDCHRDISFPRLLACPTAQRCEHCQTIHDRTCGQESHPSM